MDMVTIILIVVVILSLLFLIIGNMMDNGKKQVLTSANMLAKTFM